MDAASPVEIADLERIIDYQFTDRRHLIRALTHMSALSEAEKRSDSYQRLEFLGDRVLALVVADLLVTTYQAADEGELARRLNQLVKAETCADVARALDLGRFLILGAGESGTGGRKKKALLADSCEALIAAIYRDGGIIPARRFVEAHWRQRMLDWSGPLRDAKTMLQEWSHARGSGTPVYRIVGRQGPDHEPVFDIEVSVDRLDPAVGSGSSKREAEQNAADALLQREDGWSVSGAG